ncbi:MAG: hypothetical protein LBI54_09385 [Lachnospiraceae bacterium]|nr:hypothetical protein [Lachnospiraceae bacterium]
MDTNIMTAEQAIEAAKGLTFEKVWAALMESRAQMEETKARMREEAEQMRESHEQFREEMRESHKKTEKIVAELSKNMGGLQNSFGRFVESMFTADLCSKFQELGYEFTRQFFNTRYTESGKKIAEVDATLENGEYILLVEVKTEMRLEFVNYHLERIEKIRQYMDNHNDHRKIIGAIASGTVSESILEYAQSKGLFVIVQSGESSTLAALPEGFEPQTW